MKKPRYQLAGDMAVSVEFGEEIREETGRRVQTLYRIIKVAGMEGIRECVPSYCSLLVYYNPAILSYKRLLHFLKKCEKSIPNGGSFKKRIFEIPVCYGGEYGLDLEEVSSYTHMTQEEIISLHSKNDYLIYMLGFLPGFPYLGGMAEALATPRLSTPRTNIPAGSVGIGGSQTGIYPMDSPGGWRLIGKTPVKLYDPLRENPVLYEAGDFIRFLPITSKEYEEISKQEQDGTYQIRIKEEG